MAEACLPQNSEVTKSQLSTQDAQNPTLNTLVISKIFSFLDVRYLTTCRFVCKLWNRCALFPMFSKSKFDPRGITKRQIDQCVIAIHKGLCAPPMHFLYSFGASIKICEKYMNFYGTRVHSLELSDWEDTTTNLIFRTNRFYLSNILLAPCYLQELILHSLPVSIASAKSLFPRPLPRHPPLMYIQRFELEGLSRYSFGFLLDLLFAMPNVKEIRVNTATDTFLSTLIKVFNTHHFRHLSGFELESPAELTNGHVYELRKSGLKLKKLLLIDDDCKVGLLSLQNLLHGLHSSLEELQLPVCQYDVDNDGLISKHLVIPKMEALKKLKVADWNLLGPIGFVHKLPILEKLDIKVPRLFPENYYNVFPIEHGSELSSEIKLHTNLRELNLPMIIITSIELRNTLQSFPRLDKLTLRIDEESAHVLWELGICLKSLTIDHFSKISDSSITGIPVSPENVENIHKKMMLWDSDDANESGFNDLIPKNYIGNLKNLQNLSIEKFFGDLTDLSTVFGIAHLKKLTSLSLNSAQITDLSLTVLMKKLRLLHLDLTWGQDEPIFVSHESLQTLKLANPYLHLEYIPVDKRHFITSNFAEKLASNPSFYIPDKNIFPSPPNSNSYDSII